jgi:phosphoglycerol transferase MdoB-like AlkP superfamily enzyme
MYLQIFRRLLAGPVTRYLVLTSALCVLSAEILARPGVSDLWQWLVTDPKPILLNLLLALCMLCLFVGLTGRLFVGLLSGASLLILASVVNSLKLSNLNTPFFAWDLLYARQILALADAFFSGSFHGLYWGILPLFCLGLWALYRMRGTLVGWPGRALLLAIAALGLVGFNETGRFHLPRMLMLQNMAWDQPLNYRNNGFLLSFSMNISPLLVHQPDAYDAELINRLLAHNQELQNSPDGYKKRPVSLVILMSESFSDLPGIPFTTSQNPWENFQRISAQYPSFRVISPTFGGNTSVVEFEALTGLSYALLPNGSVPYDHYLRHPVPSLASILREGGYRTVAVHPFYPWFWSRTTAYEHLGFDRFLSIDDFKAPQLRGPYVSDKSLVDKIIEVFETEDGPLFVHAVSMQNHMPYDHDGYQDELIEVKGEMHDDLRKTLSIYLTGIRDADRELARLLQYLEKRKEPVICLFFGDHQPGLAMELAPYRSQGFPTGVASDYQLAEVPGLMWSNRADLIDAADIPGSLSPSHLPALLLHQMGIPLPGHLFHMWQGMHIYPVIHRNFIRDTSGSLAELKLFTSDPWLKSLEMLQYDVLFGKGYSTTSGGIPAAG